MDATEVDLSGSDLDNVSSVYSRPLVKIANGNVMPTLRGFRWYPYFGAQE